MPSTFAMSLTRPHEALGLPQPLARRLPQGLMAWNIAFLTLSAVMGAFYIVQVNLATSKGYDLRRVERRVDALRTENMILQDKIATMSSMQSLNARASELGFVPVERLEFVNPAGKSYALAK